MRIARFGLRICALGVFALLASAPAVSRKSNESATNVLDSLEQCHSIADPAQRLSCYDTRIVVLKEARQKGESFLPQRVEQKFQPINSTITSVAELQPGTWLLVLADRSVWKTDDDVRFFPKQGDTVRISKGALGSFLAVIGKEPAVRVKRMR